MTDTPTYPFKRGQFFCKNCDSLFFAPGDQVSFDDQLAMAPCPECGADSLETVWMKNLHSTIGSAKGANVSAEGRAKNRLNGWTTGSSLLQPGRISRIPLPPAKPGKYPECDDCQDLDDCKAQVKDKHGTCTPVYCHRKTEVTLRYASAFLSGDPEQLRLTAAGNAAQMQMVLNASYKKIFERGVEVVEKVMSWNKDGTLRKDADGNIFTTERIYAHPLIKQCINIMTAMGFSLGDWTMTPKSREAKEQATGFLAGMAAASGVSVNDVKDKISEDVRKFTDALTKANDLRAADDTLKGFEAESGQRKGDA